MSKILADNVWFKIGDAYYRLTDQLAQFIGLGTAAGKFLYTTDVKTWAEADITAAGRAILDDANASAQRTTLGLGTTALLNIGASQTGALSFTFAAPEDATVRLVINAPKAFTITATTTRTNAGTATCTFSINGTPLGGSANSASTSEQTQAHSSANAVSAGDDLTVAFSSTSADCEYLTITIAATYVLA